MKYYRLLMSERDFERMPQVIQINETECVVQAQDDAVIPNSAIEITEAEFNQMKPEIQDMVAPDITTLLGQYIVQQTLTNAELEQKIDAVGQGVTQLMLK